MGNVGNTLTMEGLVSYPTQTEQVLTLKMGL